MKNLLLAAMLFCTNIAIAQGTIAVSYTHLYRALWNFSLPMLTGGALCISLLLHGYYDILSSVMLLFYGLTLVNVSKFTYANIAWLGYAFICLGVIDSFWEGHALLFWTIGFGGFHILYGILFYFCLLYTSRCV